MSTHTRIILVKYVQFAMTFAAGALDPGEDGLDFARLKGLTGATDGSAPISIIWPARASKAVARRPRTTVKASPQGRAAFARHVAFLKAIIAGA